MFSLLRQGNSIYILDKTDVPTLKIGQIVNVSSINYLSYNQNTIDIQVKVDGEVLEFKQLPSMLSVANYNNTIISETKEQMSQEVENMIKTSKQIIENIPYHEKVIESGENILKQLNPQFAQQKDQENKINNLESKVVGIESKLDSITDLLTKALKQ